MDETLHLQVVHGLLMAIHAILAHLNNLLEIVDTVVEVLRLRLNSRKRKRVQGSSYERQLIRTLNFRRMIFDDDLKCFYTIRMDRAAFYKLCNLLETIGRLAPTKHVRVEEMVAFFLYILAHHTKNRIVNIEFVRSGETISRHVQAVLHSVLRLHEELFKKPDPVPENSIDYRWKWFKNCLGALDGTYIKVKVRQEDQPRYSTRKGDIATNVLGVCSPDLQFIYVLPGSEGSAADSRVLRSAISRSNGLKVPEGFYYLCDAGYMNGKGFLAPYRGQRYHLKEWGENALPRTKEEFFNYKHASARNVIERCFGLLKMRWAILREKSWYPVKTHCKIISACALLHNHIRREMAIDPLEARLNVSDGDSDPFSNTQSIEHIEPSNEWTAFRENLAQTMWNEWQASRNQASRNQD